MTSFDVRMGICETCEKEHGWGDIVRAVVTREFPEEAELAALTGVPANHPYWSRWKELWGRFYQPVLSWEYDDSGGALCLQHLQPLLEQMRSMESVA